MDASKETRDLGKILGQAETTARQAGYDRTAFGRALTAHLFLILTVLGEEEVAAALQDLTARSSLFDELVTTTPQVGHG